MPNNNNPADLDGQTQCYVHADIGEDGFRVKMTLCTGDVRTKHVYLSFTNEVELHISTEHQEGRGIPRFIFKFEGIFINILANCIAKYEHALQAGDQNSLYYISIEIGYIVF